MLKAFNIIIIFLVLTFGAFAQEAPVSPNSTTLTESIPEILEDYPELLNEYDELLNDYEEALDDYETLLNDYDELLTEFDNLSQRYTSLKNEFEITNTLYEGEITYHENSIKALNVANETITMLEGSVEDLLSITDPRYMAIYLQAGYLGTNVSAGIGFTIDIPKLPVSFMLDLDYLHDNQYPLNIQAGIGIKF